MRRVLAHLDINALIRRQALRERIAREPATVGGMAFARGIMAAVGLLAIAVGGVLVVLGLVELAVHGDRLSPLLAGAGVVLAGSGALLLNIVGRGR